MQSPIPQSIQPQHAQALQDSSYARQSVASPLQPYFASQGVLAVTPISQPAFGNQQIPPPAQPATQNTSLPIFPSVPNAPLQNFAQYASPIERQDQKEAMLISFD